MRNSLKNIRGIVFDLEDTLYPQVSYKRSGFQVVSAWVASKFNLEQSTVASELEHILTQYGPSYAYMFDRLVERLGIENTHVDQMVSLFIDHEPRIDCFDGVLPMLSRLRRKYRLGILTDGRYAVQQKKICALGLDSQVHEILCSDTRGLEKPAIALLRWFEKKFELKGENLIYVGDNPQKDFYGANCRGWRTVMVKTGQPSFSSIPDGYEAKVEIPAVVDLETLLRINADDGDCLSPSNGKYGVSA